MNTIVICTVHREPKVKPYIWSLDPHYSYTDDRPGIACGQTRCISGHFTGLAAYMTDETACVIEDDCIPNTNHDWMAAIKEGNDLVLEGITDIACLHARKNESLPEWGLHALTRQFEWRKPAPEGTLHQELHGTLIYVINRAAAWKFRQFDPWVTYCPIDLLMWSKNFNFLWLKQDHLNPPFIHGCGSEESILEHPKNQQFSRV